MAAAYGPVRILFPLVSGVEEIRLCRELVEEARRVSADGDRRRAAQEAAYRFMQAMAGNEAGFDEAARALFAGDIGRFEEHSATWPDDVREHAALLAADAFAH